MPTLLLFDVDGTLVPSGENIGDDMFEMLKKLKNKGYDIGIVGGGRFEKIVDQLKANNNFIVSHYFCECGNVYYTQSENKQVFNFIYKNQIKDVYKNIIENKISISMNYINSQKYLENFSKIERLFVDIRNGLIYISLIGMNASKEERQIFIEKDKQHKYIEKLINLLRKDDGISVSKGGSVGIAIFPKENDKVQVYEILKNYYENIHYFGDKYEKDGNDYELLNHKGVIGHRVDSVEDTLYQLNNF